MILNAPALAMIELASIGRGLRVTDEVAKRAPVQILSAQPLSSGKFMVLFGGEVGPVEESLAAGTAIGGERVINTLILPNLHEQVLPALDGPIEPKNLESLAIVETLSIAATVLAADAAAKAAAVVLIQIRLAQGIGGKEFFTMNGPLPDVQASVAAAAEAAGQMFLAETQIVARPHPDAAAQFIKR